MVGSATMLAFLAVADLSLGRWQTFYEIIGSAAGTLIGLQFVVVALIANVRKRIDGGSIHAFGTPTVVHFCGALIIAAIMSAPWPSFFAVSVALGLFGLYGLAYAAIVLRRAYRQTDYKPVIEDWFWHIIFPACLYSALVLAAVFLRSAQSSQFIIAAASLLFLLIGIHNAWDTVIFILVEEKEINSPASPKTERENRS
jgi:hypothetical protein